MKIAIRGGHNEKIRGSKALLDEVEVDRTYYKLVIKYIKLLGHKVLDVTPLSTDTKAQDLQYGVSRANKWGADIFISCHVNASNGEGHGCEVIYHSKSLKGREYATKISESISRLGFKNRGAKIDTRGLYEINNTNMPSIIIEPFFLDNEQDVDVYLKSTPDNLARAIVKGLFNQQLYEIEGDELIPSSVKVFSSCKNETMISEIRLLQKVCNIEQNGIATEELVKSLPELTGVETKGCVTIMQRILIHKGFLSSGSDTGIIGPANKEAINKFKTSVGISLGGNLINRITWRKLLEY